MQTITYYGVIFCSFTIFIASISSYFAWRIADPLLFITSILMVFSFSGSHNNWRMLFLVKIITP